jgi:heme A synthase
MYMPYAWVFTENDFGDMSPKLFFGALGLPAFLPAMLAGRWFEQHIQNTVWLFVLLMVIEFAFGCWLIKLGPKRTLMYLVLIVAMSIFGSFVLNALIRM